MAKKKYSGVTVSRTEQAPIIIQQTNIRPVNRQVLDIKKWRNAIRSAEALVPRRATLYDLYDDILLDGHLNSVLEKLVKKVTNAKWEFGRAGKIINAANDLIDTPEFEKLVRGIVLSEWWGLTWCTANKFTADGFSYYEIPRKHCRPETGIVAKEQTGESGINIREGIFARETMEFGDPNDIGRLKIVAQYVIYKRGAFGDWAQFAEIFGMPFRKGTYDGYDDSQRALLEQALEKAGSAAYAVVPEGSNIEFIENKSNSTGDLYKALKDACNQEISVAVLGQTETTTSSEGSGYAQSKTHAETEDDVIASTITRVRRLLNRHFIPVMQAGGVNTQGGWFYIKGEGEEKLTLKERFEMHLKMIKELELPFDAKFLYETYGMPIPTDFDAQMAERKAKSEAVPQEKPENPDDPESDPPKKGKKAAKEGVKLSEFPNLRALISQATSFFAQAPAVLLTGAENPTCSCGEAHMIRLSKENTPEFDQDGMIKRTWGRKHISAADDPPFDARLFHFTAQTLIEGMREGWKTKEVKLVDIGFSYDDDDPAMLTSFEMNLMRFSASKTLAEAQALNELFRQSKSFDDFYQKATAKLDVFNKSWLEVEYNTAVLTGQAAANYNRLMQSVELFPYWEYQTVGDDRVRAEHRLLDGLILPANHPLWKKIFPPNGWRCRCWVVGRMAHEIEGVDLKAMEQRANTFIGSDEFKRARAMGWGVNRAAIGEIFTADQFYINKFEGKATKDLATLKPVDFGLKSYSQAKKATTEQAPVFDGTIEDFTEAYPTIRDYHNRQLLFDHAAFNQEETGEKSYRSDLLASMVQALAKPSEVWIGGESLNEFIMIKYYQDKTIVVISNVRNGKVYQVTNWFALEEKAEIIDRYRAGLLVFNK
ncbi:phage portal protein family protein [Pedobacter zeae]|uniref:SPP1 gp7 family putative phage head morphogenesis protein n=1 Tax=Pedobacter zeae TaxID=1737356 RepID=A0A7W6P580_9SPHI|nr:DUF935 family protein [Pedobacter zeae]MBB4106629.1 SPP1 gp7 family putative phage head morphogenesis protein [Pedobacter zeae]GGH02816.1 hypothetical protein GCM10007422_17490 [Pedobacter zeae]